MGTIVLVELGTLESCDCWDVTKLELTMVELICVDDIDDDTLFEKLTEGVGRIVVLGEVMILES